MKKKKCSENDQTTSHFEPVEPDNKSFSELFFFFFRPWTWNLKKKSRKSTNNKNLT